jgi:hypothetical protein
VRRRTFDDSDDERVCENVVETQVLVGERRGHEEVGGDSVVVGGDAVTLLLCFTLDLGGGGGHGLPKGGDVRGGYEVWEGEEAVACMVEGYRASVVTKGAGGGRGRGGRWEAWRKGKTAKKGKDERWRISIALCRFARDHLPACPPLDRQRWKASSRTARKRTAFSSSDRTTKDGCVGSFEVGAVFVACGIVEEVVYLRERSNDKNWFERFDSNPARPSRPWGSRKSEKSKERSNGNDDGEEARDDSAETWRCSRV